MDAQLDFSSTGRVSRLEVLDGPTGRKQRSETERARIAAESFRPGVSVSEVARRYGATRSQVYDWRRRLKDGRLALAGGVAAMPAFAEVMVTLAAAADAGVLRPSAIETDIAGTIIRVPSGVEAEALSRVIRAVRKASVE
ncbi:IS66-like element accessory protein TnpA [Aestuariivirga sp.]|jgi:transposase|uniref:IS66-like element accessory protein TnpA n=1 Tax=Aestuariivirga sp. TaxID=2650926 RepID=UPI0037846F53